MSRLNSEYFVQDVGDGFEVSCEQYFLPDYLHEHIHYITPGVKGSDVTTRVAKNRPYKRSNGKMLGRIPCFIYRISL